MKKYSKICSTLEVASQNVACLFVRKMYEIPDSEPTDEIYFIGQDPTGTLGYGDHFWSLDTMYETLLKDYPIKDVWNWYYYTIEHCGEDREGYLNLNAFCGMYGGYDEDLSLLYKKEISKREANRIYNESAEGKKELADQMEKIKQEFIDNKKI